ncbi:hypothetical protein [Paenibacillus oleatilyticus]
MMNSSFEKNKYFILKIISLIAALIGVYYLLNSPELGLKSTTIYMSNNTSGSIATSTYSVFLESSIISYRIFGGILTFVGGYFFLKH